MKKKISIAFGAVVIFLIIAFFTITNGLTEGENLALNGIDLSQISDGDYTGTYEQGRWTNTLTVRVENHKIIGINIDKDVAAAGITDCSEELFRRVMEENSTQVDAVSGATVTSKAYLKAIESALIK